MDDVYCFGGNPLDRASERRDDGDWIAKLLGDPETRLLALRDLKPFTRGTAVPALDWQPVAQWRDQIDAGAPLIFLGLGDGRAHFAIDAAGADITPDIDTELIDVRALAPALAPREAGVRGGRVRYLAAQPWPFPSSLMMGFLAEALTEEITVDAEELAEARWFSRDEIREMVARAAAGPDDPSQVSLPSPIAIAHHICRRWSSGLDSV